MIFYRKIKFWILIAVIIITAFFLSGNYFKSIEVKGYEVRKQELIISVTATSTGTIKADKDIKITAQRIGRISKLLVEEGSIVNKGGLVAEFDYDEHMQKMSASSAALQKIRATLEALKLNLNSFKADVEANISKNSSILNETESRFKRFNELKDKGYISQLEYDSVKREYDIAKSGYDSSIVSREQIKSKKEEIKAQEAAVDQAMSEYALAKINYEYSFIRTPISGIITSRPVKVGETVGVGALIASVVSTDTLYIEAFIDEADVAKLSLGQPVHISMDAYQGKVFNGEVYMISPVVLGGRQEARTFEIRVRLLDKGIIVKPGMSADVEVIVDRFRDTLIVPSQAIIEKGEVRFVYVNRGGKAVPAKVKTGQFNWNFTEVTEGVKEGDMVITNPDLPGLKDGMRVKIVKNER